MIRAKPKLIIIYYPETNGQTKITNKEMERYIHTYCNYMQDNWLRYLGLVELAINFIFSITTKVSFFFSNKGY
jgi:hypothetical protein